MDNTTAPLVRTAPLFRQHRLSVEAEASLMNRGRGRQLFWLGGGALLVLASAVVLAQRITRGDGYSNAAASISQIEHEHFDAFFGCALPDTRITELSPARLTSALTRQAELLGKGYASRLEGCMKHTQALEMRVAGLEVPAAVEPQHRGLVVAANTLALATTDYASYLASSDRTFELTRATPMIGKLVTAWAGYRTAQGQLEEALEQHR